MTGDSDAVDELTALRRENEALRETLDAIDGSVVVYDSDLTYRFGNADYHAAYPFLPAEAELAGLPFERVLGLLIAARAATDPRAYSDTDAYVKTRRAEMMDRSSASREIYLDDQDRWWQVRVKWTPAGHRVALRIDITELKRLRQELLRAERMDTVGRLARVVAQDFNNLLTVIVSNLELMRRRAGDPARLTALIDRAIAAAETGARLSRQLLSSRTAIFRSRERWVRTNCCGRWMSCCAGRSGPTSCLRSCREFGSAPPASTVRSSSVRS